MKEMAIDIVTIKNGCKAIQATASEYDKVIEQLESARNACKADKLDIDGATMGQKFEEIEELVKQVKNATIETANQAYEYARQIYNQQKEQEEAQQQQQNS